MLYGDNTLGQEIMCHQNDYGFDADHLARQYRGPLPSASLLIPYFNAYRTINNVISHVVQAIEIVTLFDPDWDFEILLLDDGSDRYPLLSHLCEETHKYARIETLPHQGRCIVRNTALSLSRYEIAVFIDADVLVHPHMLLRHLQLHAQSKNVISFSLFDFHPLSMLSQSLTLLQKSKPNDWRLECIYQKEWYGCTEDRKFAGTYFAPLIETQMLRRWPRKGFYGPWILPNMVLGGFFAIHREKALAVGGCSPMFDTYAFEETSLVTKIVATYHDYVVPLTEHFALHIEDVAASEQRQMKYQLFREAHHRYFSEFLCLEKSLLDPILHNKH